MNMYTLKDINDKFFTFQIKDRGYHYHREGRVKNLRLDKGTVSAAVRGSKQYEIKIRFNKELMPTSLSCTCPYAAGANCKHQAAVLFHLNSLGFFTTDYYRREIWAGLGLDADEMARQIKEKQEAAAARAHEEFRKKTELKALRKKMKKEVSSGRQRTIGGTIAKEILERIEREIANEQEPPKPRKEPSYEEQEKMRADKQLDIFKMRISRLMTVKRPPPKMDHTPELAIGFRPDYHFTHFYCLSLRRNEAGTITGMSFPEASEIASNLTAPSELIAAMLSLSLSGRSASVQFPFDEYDQRPLDISTSRRISRILNNLKGRQLYCMREYQDLGGTFALISGEEGTATVQLDFEETKSKLELSFSHPVLGKIPFQKAKPVLPEPLWFMYDSTLFRVENFNLPQYMTFKTTDGVISVKGANQDFFSKEVLPLLPEYLPLVSDSLTFDTVETAPVAQVYLEEVEEDLRIKLCFLYGTYVLSYEKNLRKVVVRDGKNFVSVVRDRNFEDRTFISFKEFGLKRYEGPWFLPKIHPCDFLLDRLPKMVAAGIQIFGEESLKKFKAASATPKLSLRISSGTDWFEVEADVHLNEHIIPLHQLLSRRNQSGFIRLDDGTTVKIDEEILAKLGKHTALAETEGEKLRFSRTQFGAVEALIQDSEEAETDSDFAEFARQLKDFASIEKQPVPKNLKAKLRPYQKHGFDWFFFLQKYGFGGILADDMGLGKTMQVLTLLLHEQAAGNKTPSLVVAPTSVIFNWMKEVEHFAPSLKVLNHTGIERITDAITHFAEYDIILTTYGIVLRDVETLKQQEFRYIVLDESQKIKNPITKSSRSVRLLKAKYRLCLSGTPVENNLLELWAQFAFVNPGMLGSLHGFQSRFIKQIERGKGEEIEGYIRKIIYPFILRRTKEVVAKDLPRKTEIVHMCEMTPEQETYYNAVRDSIRSELLQKIDSKGIESSGILILEALLRLRQICNHPHLVNKDFAGSSGKFEEFKEMILRSIEENHKVLIFSQFVTMLAMMKKFIEHAKIRYEYLDGATTNRQQCVENFQDNPDVKLFLISLKAGGFGLNLTSADNVFLFDPWWNPAVEKQAADRTHRIGQTKPVFIYKFITKGTVEEKILELQERKRNLVEKIITSEKGLFKSLTRKDIDNLFS